MKEKHILCFDYGASSGRAIIGSFDGSKLTLNEIYRFKNEPVTIGKDLCWDINSLYKHMKSGIAKAVSLFDIESMAADTWGVDFGLIGQNGELLSNPFHYRHHHTSNIIEETKNRFAGFNLFKETGNALQPYNTFFQLLAMMRDDNSALKKAKKLLFMPDLFNYFLTGEAHSERTIASTSQLTIPSANKWNLQLINGMGIDESLLQGIIPAGMKIGCINQKVINELNINQKISVYSTASHDTAAAVAAIPASSDNFIYISSGTWSLLGTVIDKPVLTENAFKYGYTNECAADGKIRMLKSIMGLWIIQECKKDWEAEGKPISFLEIAAHAKKAAPFKCFINPDDTVFYAPGSMTMRIRDYCKKTGQYIPDGIGEIARCVFESLAFAYREGVENLEKITGKKYSELYIAGGGSSNEVLNRFTASAVNKCVIAGVPEATSAGNIICQLKGLNLISNLNEGREIVRNSFECTTYMPENPAHWDESYERYQKIIKNNI